jgi:hypothetical protein
MDNRCKTCPFFWELRLEDDFDCGCVFGDCGRPRFLNFICRVPKPLRKVVGEIYWRYFLNK